MKKPISILIVMCVMLSLTLTPLSAFAASDGDRVEAQTRYLYIGVLSAGLSINSNGKATCSGVVQTTTPNTSLSITVELQQYKNNKWTTIESWDKTGPGNKSLDKSGEYYVSSGYSYRVVSTASVYDANGRLLETQSKTTTEKWY